MERFVSQSPKDLLIAPDWGLKNYEFVARLQKRMKASRSYVILMRHSRTTDQL